MFLALAAATPQDSFDFRTRYGDPDVERFNLRPGITMTAEYGPDGKACLLDIEPRKDFLRDMEADETLSMETVTSVLDEIVAPDTRGKETLPLFSGQASTSCNHGFTWGDYDNIQIGLVYAFCVKPIGIHSATIKFKRAACGQPPIDLACLERGTPCVF